jgi:LCP family protein required for cell wall assembly
MPLVDQPAGTINILLLGMDRNAGEGTARTDVMVIASVFPDVPAVSLLSIPRDYYAWIPAWGLDKINTAYPRAGKVAYPGGGPALTMATVTYNFGVPIHYYAMVDFTSYRRIVDAVGGVDVVVECPLHDTYPDAESETGQTDIDLEPGVHHLDGKFALWYVRSRWSTSDFDRHRRQQQVLLAILRQARSENMLVRVPELWETYRESVETDLGVKELLTLASVASRLDERNVTTSFIRSSDVITPWTAPNGGYVLVPNQEAVQNLVRSAMQPLSANRASQRAYRVVVSNGSWSSAFGDVAAYRLGLEGLLVTEIETVPAEPRTQVIDFTTTAKGSPLYRLISLYRLQEDDITRQPTENSAVDFQVILGTNYNPCTGTGTAYWRSTPTPAPTPTPTPP